MAYCGPRGIPWEEFCAWSKPSRDSALAWDLQQRQTCGSCGTRPDQHTHARAFVARAVSCPGCKVLEEARAKSRQDQKRGQGNASVRHVLVPNTPRS